MKPNTEWHAREGLRPGRSGNPTMPQGMKELEQSTKELERSMEELERSMEEVEQGMEGRADAYAQHVARGGHQFRGLSTWLELTRERTRSELVSWLVHVARASFTTIQGNSARVGTQESDMGTILRDKNPLAIVCPSGCRATAGEQAF